ncbi:MAG: IS110 family transposase [Sulfitobacter pontiacus]|uniref:IS110 family transposase n=1 Tax=Sulfitobacter pontiacus TaxID=60137 RepID=UPI0032647748
MSEVAMIGIDLAKRVFQLHGACPNGTVVFRKKLTRIQLLAFMSQQSACIVAMEACATAHSWGRQFETLGHTVRLIAPNYVKPFVKRQKNDVADAEAQQARAMLFRTRQMFVGQRTQTINALRGHLAEHGVVAPQGAIQVKRLADAVTDETVGLPAGVRELAKVYIVQIEDLSAQIAALDRQMKGAAKEAEAARRAQTMPGVGPITALAIETFAPDLNCFRRGRDFAAWLGLVPKQTSTGGRPRLGKTSKMGQRDIRRLLISGAMAVLQAVERFGKPHNGWLISMLERKPRMLVAVALANKMARGLWAMVTKQEDYQNPAMMV